MYTRVYIRAINSPDGQCGIIVKLGEDAVLMTALPGPLELNLPELHEASGKVAGSAVICLYVAELQAEFTETGK